VTFLGALHPEQEPAFRAIKTHDLGVLAVAPSFGKTVLGARMIAERGVNTLIIVHNKAILDQWLSRLPMFLDIAPKYLGVMRGGKKKPTGIIDVALWQSLNRGDVVDDIVANYGHLIVDECHHVAATEFELIAKAVKARYVLGLSATPVRKDGHHPIIFMQCGPVRYRVSPKELAASRPFEHTIIPRHTQFGPIIRDECSRVWQPNVPSGTEASATANLQMKRLRATRPSKVLICAAQKKFDGKIWHAKRLTISCKIARNNFRIIT
jgi:superfamily II DNA or RNA helicase